VAPASTDSFEELLGVARPTLVWAPVVHWRDRRAGVDWSCVSMRAVARCRVPAAHHRV